MVLKYCARLNLPLSQFSFLRSFIKNAAYLASSHQNFVLDGNYGGASHHCGLDKNGALFYLISFDKSWAQSVILDLFLRIKSDRSLWPPFEFWRHCDSLLKKDCKKYFQLWCQYWSVHDRGQQLIVIPWMHYLINCLVLWRL